MSMKDYLIGSLGLFKSRIEELFEPCIMIIVLFVIRSCFSFNR